jgi:hypothetical protein
MAVFQAFRCFSDNVHVEAVIQRQRRNYDSDRFDRSESDEDGDDNKILSQTACVSEGGPPPPIMRDGERKNHHIRRVSGGSKRRRWHD